MSKYLVPSFLSRNYAIKEKNKSRITLMGIKSVLNSTTLDAKEIKNFESLALKWWDPLGPFRPLHLLNPARLLFIKQQIQNHYGLSADKLKPYVGLKILDVGCGGGLLSEPLARNGAQVTGIDAGSNAIGIAQCHAQEQGLTIDYYLSTVEEHLGHQKQYDIVIASEILEHVINIPDFIKSVKMLVKPQGLIIFSTLNRTYKSFGIAILGAEYIMKILPTGTHDWKKFLKPSELGNLCRQEALMLRDIQGMKLNLWNGKFELGPDVSINYIICVQNI